MALETPERTHPHEAKEPVTVAAGPYGHPFHPIFVTIPIGAWVASLVFDVVSRAADDGAPFVEGASWLIGIGIAGALAAALFGFLDLLTIPRGTRAFRVALTHMALNLTVTGLYVGNFLWRRGDVNDAVEVAGGQLALSAVALVLLSVSGFLGGMLSYRYGVRVADEETQAEGYRR